VSCPFCKSGADDRIYPVPVKPKSTITNWGQWPADAEPQIRKWNRQGLLSFGGSGGVFKCIDCQEFCLHGMTAFVRTRREKKRGWDHGAYICDDCLIERARNA
jgi:hypothetical protein